MTAVVVAACLIVVILAAIIVFEELANREERRQHEAAIEAFRDRSSRVPHQSTRCVDLDEERDRRARSRFNAHRRRSDRA